MPNTSSIIQGLDRVLEVDLAGEVAAAIAVDAAMRRYDRLEIDAIRRHLFGDLAGALTGADRR